MLYRIQRLGELRSFKALSHGSFSFVTYLHGKMRQFISFRVDNVLIVAIPEVIYCLSVHLTLLDFSTCNASDIFNAASLSQREILMYFIWSVNVIFLHFSLKRAFVVMCCITLFWILSQCHRDHAEILWMFDTSEGGSLLSNLVATFECCSRLFFHDPSQASLLWSYCDRVDNLTCLTTLNAFQSRRVL